MTPCRFAAGTTSFRASTTTSTHSFLFGGVAGERPTAYLHRPQAPSDPSASAEQDAAGSPETQGGWLLCVTSPARP
jgi:hypothetical protein